MIPAAPLPPPFTPRRVIIELDPVPGFDALLWDGYLEDGGHIRCEILEHRTVRIVQLQPNGERILLDEAPILLLSEQPQDILEAMGRAFPSTVFPAAPTRPEWPSQI